MIVREYVIERRPFGAQEWAVKFTLPDGWTFSYISPDPQAWVEADDRLWWRLSGKYEASKRLRGHT